MLNIYKKCVQTIECIAWQCKNFDTITLSARFYTIWFSFLFSPILLTCFRYCFGLLFGLLVDLYCLACLLFHSFIAPIHWTSIQREYIQILDARSNSMKIQLQEKKDKVSRFKRLLGKINDCLVRKQLATHFITRKLIATAANGDK